MKTNIKTPIDRLIFNIINKWMFEIVLGILVGISIVVRMHLAPVCILSADYNNFYEPWFRHYKTLGIVKGLGSTVGDYYVPYNLFLALCTLLPFKPYVMISFASCISEYIGAFFIYKILLLITGCDSRDSYKQRALLSSVCLLFLPVAIMNGALWKQCDAVYTCLIIISLYCLLKNKYRMMFIIFSFAFCLKLQAIFFLPLIVIIYIAKQEFSILEFLWMPAMYLFTGIPEILCGRGIKDTYRVYFRQMHQELGMCINTPNIYQFGLFDYPSLSQVAILCMAAIFVAAAGFCYKHRDKITSEIIVYICIWVTWTCYMFLPAMHERYDYLTIILISAYMIFRKSKLLWTAIVMNLCGIVTYSNCLFGGSKIPIIVITIPYCIAYFAVTTDLMKKLSQG